MQLLNRVKQGGKVLVVLAQLHRRYLRVIQSGEGGGTVGSQVWLGLGVRVIFLIRLLPGAKVKRRTATEAQQFLQGQQSSGRGEIVQFKYAIDS